MAIDEELGMVYLPVETPTNDYYGGGRPGNNLFAGACVARRSEDRRSASGTSRSFTIRSGTSTCPRRRSSPTSPSTAARSRRSRMPSKQALSLRVRSRRPGSPVWPIEERPVREGQRAWRVVLADAAVSRRSRPRTRDRRFTSDELDRLHAGASREGGRDSRRKFALAKLFDPPVLSKPEGPLAVADVFYRARRHQLAGRFVRSRDAHRVRPPISRSWVSASCRSPTSGSLKRRTSAATSSQACAMYASHSGDGPRLNGGKPPDKPAAPGNPVAAAGNGRGISRRAPNVEGFRSTSRHTASSPRSISIAARSSGRCRTAIHRIKSGITGAQGPEHPAHRAADQRRHARHQDARHCRRAKRHDRRTSARRAARAYDKATGKDAGAVLMEAPQTGSPMTDMWQRQAVHRRGDQRSERAGAVCGVRAARSVSQLRRRTEPRRRAAIQTTPVAPESEPGLHLMRPVSRTMPTREGVPDSGCCAWCRDGAASPRAARARARSAGKRDNHRRRSIAT